MADLIVMHIMAILWYSRLIMKHMPHSWSLTTAHACNLIQGRGKTSYKEGKIIIMLLKMQSNRYNNCKGMIGS